MGVTILSGEKFEGVDFGSACGGSGSAWSGGPGYVIGTTPISKLLLVDEKKHSAYIIGVKYYHHPAGDPGGTPRIPCSCVRMTMLVSKGRWRQRIWSVSGEWIEVLLHKPGDYIAWGPGLWHSWYPEADSTMLTVSFKRKSAEPVIWRAAAVRPLRHPTLSGLTAAARRAMTAAHRRCHN